MRLWLKGGGKVSPCSLTRMKCVQSPKRGNSRLSPNLTSPFLIACFCPTVLYPLCALKCALIPKNLSEASRGHTGSVSSFCPCQLCPDAKASAANIGSRSGLIVGSKCVLHSKCGIQIVSQSTILVPFPFLLGLQTEERGGQPQSCFLCSGSFSCFI